MEDTDLLCLPNGVQGRVQPTRDLHYSVVLLETEQVELYD